MLVLLFFSFIALSAYCFYRSYLQLGADGPSPYRRLRPRQLPTGMHARDYSTQIGAELFMEMLQHSHTREMSADNRSPRPLKRGGNHARESVRHGRRSKRNWLPLMRRPNGVGGAAFSRNGPWA